MYLPPITRVRSPSRWQAVSQRCVICQVSATRVTCLIYGRLFYHEFRMTEQRDVVAERLCFVLQFINKYISIEYDYELNYILAANKKCWAEFL